MGSEPDAAGGRVQPHQEMDTTEAETSFDPGTTQVDGIGG
jgi:hypothetical protein